jgi:hypothetical protein
MIDPLPEYEARHAAWLSQQAFFNRQFIAIGNARLALGIVSAL